MPNSRPTGKALIVLASLSYAWSPPALAGIGLPTLPDPSSGLFGTVGATLVAVLAAMVWNRTLQRKVAVAVARLKQREEELQAVADHTPDTIARYDLECRRTYANRTLAALAGVRIEDLLGKTPSESINSKHTSTFEAHIREVIAGGEVASVEMPWPDRDGSTMIRQIRLVPEKAADGRVVSVLGVGRDVTRLKALEAQARQEAARYATLMRNLPGNVFTLRYRPDGMKTFEYWGGTDEYALSPVGASAEEIFAATHPDDRDLLFTAVPSRLREHGVSDHRFRYLRKNGFRWVHAWERVSRWDGDDMIVDGLVLDVTKEVAAEEALHGNLNKMWAMAANLQTLISNLSGVVFRMEYLPDGSTRILERFGEFGCGHGEHGFDDETLRAMIHPEDREVMFVDVPRRLRETGRCEQQFRMVIPGRGTVWVLTREKVVERERDRMIVEGQAFDITADILIKQDLEESERRWRRAENRLRESQRFEALGQLAGGVAHDFNNLLGAILGFAQFIIDDSIPGTPTHRHAGRIATIAHKGRMTVEQIMNYSRQKELVCSRFALPELISETVALCKADCLPEIAFSVEVNVGAAEIEADREQLGRVLMNLCINARDSLNGEGTVTIGVHEGSIDGEALRRLVERDQAGGGADVETWQGTAGESWAVAGRLPRVMPHVTLFVADTGTGMEVNLLGQIFAPFFTTKDRSRGTGLGLAVVHGIVLAHGGALVVRSRPGAGTRFEILLPRSHASGISAPTGGKVGGLPVKARILLVDDNADICEATAEALCRLDFAVTPFSDPAEALDAFHRTPDAWDVVITDQVMPNIRGTEMIARIRTVRPALPCLLCTGFAEDLTTASCKQAGAADVLRKPISLTELIAVIERALAGKSVEKHALLRSG